MTTHDDDAPRDERDAVAMAREIIALVDSGQTVRESYEEFAPLLRALADECEALRAANLKLVAERLKVARENYEAGFQDAIDDFKHAAAPEPPSRETATEE